MTEATEQQRRLARAVEALAAPVRAQCAMWPPDAIWMEGVLTGIALERRFGSTAAQLFSGAQSLSQLATDVPAEVWESRQVEAAVSVDRRFRAALEV